MIHRDTDDIQVTFLNQVQLIFFIEVRHKQLLESFISFSELFFSLNKNNN